MASSAPRAHRLGAASVGGAVGGVSSGAPPGGGAAATNGVGGAAAGGAAAAAASAGHHNSNGSNDAHGHAHAHPIYSPRKGIGFVDASRRCGFFLRVCACSPLFGLR
jgi:hypothetical protein